MNEVSTQFWPQQRAARAQSSYEPRFLALAACCLYATYGRL